MSRNDKHRRKLPTVGFTRAQLDVSQENSKATGFPVEIFEPMKTHPWSFSCSKISSGGPGGEAPPAFAQKERLEK